MVYRKFIDANTDLYGTFYPPTNYYGHINCLYGPLQDLTETPALLQTITDLLIAFTDHYKTS